MHAESNKIPGLNYPPIIENIKGSLNAWKRRHLTLIGRNVVVKSLAVSKLTFLMSVLPTVDKAYFDDINSCLLKYLWDDKRPKIKNEVLCLDYENGGISFPNILFTEMGMKIT